MRHTSECGTSGRALTAKCGAHSVGSGLAREVSCLELARRLRRAAHLHPVGVHLDHAHAEVELVGQAQDLVVRLQPVHRALRARKESLSSRVHQARSRWLSLRQEICVQERFRWQRSFHVASSIRGLQAMRPSDQHAGGQREGHSRTLAHARQRSERPSPCMRHCWLGTCAAKLEEIARRRGSPPT